MSAHEFMSKSEFALYIGRAPSFITWLAKNERLVMAPDGKRVDVAASIALIGQTADPSKAGVVERHAAARADKFGELADGLAKAPKLSHESPKFQEAKAHREYYEGKISEAKFRRLERELVEREAVDAAAFTTARTLRDILLGLPAQVSGELVAISDPWQMENRLTELLRRALADAAGLIQLDAALSPDDQEPN